MPRVSILLPAFDAADTLPTCLQSVLRQTELGWECIIVDDGSTDATAAVARDAAARDPRFVVVGTPHRGLVGALATGLAHCRAPVTARMDADDVMHRQRLALQLAALDASPGLSAVGCHVRIFPRTQLGDGWRSYEQWIRSVDSPERVRAEAFVECPIVHPTLAIRTDVLRALGYHDRGWPEDYDLVLRLLAAGHDIGVVPRRLLAWRDRADRLTRTAAAYGIDRITDCKASFLADGFLAGTETYVLWGYGGTGRALRSALVAHGKRPSHIVEVHPGRIGNTIHGAPVIPWEALSGLPDARVIVSVAGAEPRRLCRDALTGMGRRETRDFVCAA